MNSLVMRFCVSAEEAEGAQLVRPSQLPFYDESPEPRFQLVEREPSVLEQNIKLARQEVSNVASQLGEVAEKVNHVYETGKAHTQGAYHELLAEENLPMRLGVITASGLVGLVIGRFRGGLVKRLLYTGLGVGAGGAICYPTEAAQVSEEVYLEARKKAMIAYNFVAGVESPGSGPDTRDNLIASSISRLSTYSLRLIRDLKETVAPSTSSGGGTSKQIESEANKKHEEIVFIGANSDAPREVEGDPGQGKEEDKDLYTTRTA